MTQQETKPSLKSPPADSKPPTVQKGPAPALEWGVKASSSWREGAITRVHELDSLHEWLISNRTSRTEGGMDAAIHWHLSSAQRAAVEDHNPWRLATGAIYERINSNCDAAEANLLRITPDEFVVGQVPGLVAHVERNLPTTDTRRIALELLASGFEQDKIAGKPITLDESQRTQLIGAVRAASSQAGRDQAAVRSFRNVLGVTTLVLVFLAAAVAVLGFLNPTSVPLCFNPEESGQELIVCPTGQSPLIPVTAGGASRDIDDVVDETVSRADLFTVEFIGLIAAAVASAAGLRRLRGSTLPFGLPATLAVLKLPTGALTAFIGLLLMRGQFVPGLSALDSSAQILAWAALFGYAQQLLTRLVDQQADSVLDRVRGAKHQVSTDAPTA